MEPYRKPEPLYRYGRPGYNSVNMLKTILFGFMDTGYASRKEWEDHCRVNICYMYQMDHEMPSCCAFGYFIKEEINGKAEDMFRTIMEYIRKEDSVDLERDAGYGSFNNYIYCQEHGMEKYMKFPMYKKETKDKEYHDNLFRTVTFNTDSDGDLV